VDFVTVFLAAGFVTTGDFFAGDFFTGILAVLLAAGANDTALLTPDAFFAGDVFAATLFGAVFDLAGADFGALAIVFRISSSKEAAPRLADDAPARDA
jgi:hypothetical protein